MLLRGLAIWLMILFAATHAKSWSAPAGQERPVVLADVVAGSLGLDKSDLDVAWDCDDCTVFVTKIQGLMDNRKIWTPSAACPVPGAKMCTLWNDVRERNLLIEDASTNICPQEVCVAMSKCKRTPCEQCQVMMGAAAHALKHKTLADFASVLAQDAESTCVDPSFAEAHADGVCSQTTRDVVVSQAATLKEYTEQEISLKLCEGFNVCADKSQQYSVCQRSVEPLPVLKHISGCSYHYGFTSGTRITMGGLLESPKQGAAAEKAKFASTVDINADYYITKVGDVNSDQQVFQLKVIKAAVVTQQADVQLTDALQQNDFYFVQSAHGKIEKVIFTKEETLRTVNLKRQLIRNLHFQASAAPSEVTLMEEDIDGMSQARYTTATGPNNQVQVKKRKDGQDKDLKGLKRNDQVVTDIDSGRGIVKAAIEYDKLSSGHLTSTDGGEGLESVAMRWHQGNTLNFKGIEGTGCQAAITSEIKRKHKDHIDTSGIKELKGVIDADTALAKGMAYADIDAVARHHFGEHGRVSSLGAVKEDAPVFEPEDADDDVEETRPIGEHVDALLDYATIAPEDHRRAALSAIEELLRRDQSRRAVRRLGKYLHASFDVTDDLESFDYATLPRGPAQAEQRLALLKLLVSQPDAPAQDAALALLQHRYASDDEKRMIMHGFLTLPKPTKRLFHHVCMLAEMGDAADTHSLGYDGSAGDSLSVASSLAFRLPENHEGVRRVLDIAHERLAASDAWSQELGLIALGNLGLRESLPKITPHLTSYDAALRDQAVTSLRRIPGDDVNILLRQHFAAEHQEDIRLTALSCLETRQAGPFHWRALATQLQQNAATLPPLTPGVAQRLVTRLREHNMDAATAHAADTEDLATSLLEMLLDDEEEEDAPVPSKAGTVSANRPQLAIKAAKPAVRIDIAPTANAEPGQAHEQELDQLDRDHTDFLQAHAQAIQGVPPVKLEDLSHARICRWGHVCKINMVAHIKMNEKAVQTDGTLKSYDEQFKIGTNLEVSSMCGNRDEQLYRINFKSFDISKLQGEDAKTPMTAHSLWFTQNKKTGAIEKVAADPADAQDVVKLKRTLLRALARKVSPQAFEQAKAGAAPVSYIFEGSDEVGNYTTKHTLVRTAQGDVQITAKTAYKDQSRASKDMGNDVKKTSESTTMVSAAGALTNIQQDAKVTVGTTEPPPKDIVQASPSMGRSHFVETLEVARLGNDDQTAACKGVPATMDIDAHVAAHMKGAPKWYTLDSSLNELSDLTGPGAKGADAGEMMDLAREHFESGKEKLDARELADLVTPHTAIPMLDLALAMHRNKKLSVHNVQTVLSALSARRNAATYVGLLRTMGDASLDLEIRRQATVSLLNRNHLNEKAPLSVVLQLADMEKTMHATGQVNAPDATLLLGALAEHHTKDPKVADILESMRAELNSLSSSGRMHQAEAATARAATLLMALGNARDEGVQTQAQALGDDLEAPEDVRIAAKRCIAQYNELRDTAENIDFVGPGFDLPAPKSSEDLAPPKNTPWEWQKTFYNTTLPLTGNKDFTVAVFSRAEAHLNNKEIGAYASSGITAKVYKQEANVLEIGFRARFGPKDPWAILHPDDKFEDGKSTVDVPGARDKSDKTAAAPKLNLLEEDEEETENGMSAWKQEYTREAKGIGSWECGDEGRGGKGWRHCCVGKPCGDSCIHRGYTCHKPPGRACARKFGDNGCYVPSQSYYDEKQEKEQNSAKEKCKGDKKCLEKATAGDCAGTDAAKKPQCKPPPEESKYGTEATVGMFMMIMGKNVMSLQYRWYNRDIQYGGPCPASALDKVSDAAVREGHMYQQTLIPGFAMTIPLGGVPVKLAISSVGEAGFKYLFAVWVNCKSEWKGNDFAGLVGVMPMAQIGIRASASLNGGVAEVGVRGDVVILSGKVPAYAVATTTHACANVDARLEAASGSIEVFVSIGYRSFKKEWPYELLMWKGSRDDRRLAGLCNPISMSSFVTEAVPPAKPIVTISEKNSSTTATGGNGMPVRNTHRWTAMVGEIKWSKFDLNSMWEMNRCTTKGSEWSFSRFGNTTVGPSSFNAGVHMTLLGKGKVGKDDWCGGVGAEVGADVTLFGKKITMFGLRVESIHTIHERKARPLIIIFGYQIAIKKEIVLKTDGCKATTTSLLCGDVQPMLVFPPPGRQGLPSGSSPMLNPVVIQVDRWSKFNGYVQIPVMGVGEVKVGISLELTAGIILEPCKRQGAGRFVVGVSPGMRINTWSENGVNMRVAGGGVSMNVEMMQGDLVMSGLFSFADNSPPSCPTLTSGQAIHFNWQALSGKMASYATLGSMRREMMSMCFPPDPTDTKTAFIDLPANHEALPKEGSAVMFLDQNTGMVRCWLTAYACQKAAELAAMASSTVSSVSNSVSAGVSKVSAAASTAGSAIHNAASRAATTTTTAVHKAARATSTVVHSAALATAKAARAVGSATVHAAKATTTALANSAKAAAEKTKAAVADAAGAIKHGTSHIASLSQASAAAVMAGVKNVAAKSVEAYRVVRRMMKTCKKGAGFYKHGLDVVYCHVQCTANTNATCPSIPAQIRYSAALFNGGTMNDGKVNMGEVLDKLDGSGGHVGSLVRKLNIVRRQVQKVEDKVQDKLNMVKGKVNEVKAKITHKVEELKNTVVAPIKAKYDAVKAQVMEKVHAVRDRYMKIIDTKLAAMKAAADVHIQKLRETYLQTAQQKIDELKLKYGDRAKSAMIKIKEAVGDKVVFVVNEALFFAKQKLEEQRQKYLAEAQAKILEMTNKVRVEVQKFEDAALQPIRSARAKLQAKYDAAKKVVTDKIDAAKDAAMKPLRDLKKKLDDDMEQLLKEEREAKAKGDLAKANQITAQIVVVKEEYNVKVTRVEISITEMKTEVNSEVNTAEMDASESLENLKGGLGIDDKDTVPDTTTQLEEVNAEFKAAEAKLEAEFKKMTKIHLVSHPDKPNGVAKAVDEVSEEAGADAARSRAKARDEASTTNDAVRSESSSADTTTRSAAERVKDTAQKDESKVVDTTRNQAKRDRSVQRDEQRTVREMATEEARRQERQTLRVESRSEKTTEENRRAASREAGTVTRELKDMESEKSVEKVLETASRAAAREERAVKKISSRVETEAEHAELRSIQKQEEKDESFVKSEVRRIDAAEEAEANFKRLRDEQRRKVADEAEEAAMSKLAKEQRELLKIGAAGEKAADLVEKTLQKQEEEAAAAREMKRAESKIATIQEHTTQTEDLVNGLTNRVLKTEKMAIKQTQTTTHKIMHNLRTQETRNTDYHNDESVKLQARREAKREEDGTNNANARHVIRSGFRADRHEAREMAKEAIAAGSNSGDFVKREVARIEEITSKAAKKNVEIAHLMKKTLDRKLTSAAASKRGADHRAELEDNMQHDERTARRVEKTTRTTIRRETQRTSSTARNMAAEEEK